MLNRVVSTKLTEEEHQKLLDVCNTAGKTPSMIIRESIIKMITGSRLSESNGNKVQEFLNAFLMRRRSEVPQQFLPWRN
jgi:hypothetical protein